MGRSPGGHLPGQEAQGQPLPQCFVIARPWLPVGSSGRAISAAAGKWDVVAMEAPALRLGGDVSQAGFSVHRTHRRASPSAPPCPFGEQLPFGLLRPGSWTCCQGPRARLRVSGSWPRTSVCLISLPLNAQDHWLMGSQGRLQSPSATCPGLCPRQRGQCGPWEPVPVPRLQPRV